MLNIAKNLDFVYIVNPNLIKKLYKNKAILLYASL